ncbi:3-carboxy-cis,cis-mucoante lactonizing enzyme [Lindgomyces ingoldianus]|uniref:3-carboxy-cis,cis-mucoante lactonizing enzyme n=1 Tax=Lindgomyces ingoldianus TaxID=673940 RepID=A0ACB6R4H0_9PLEO|nr:3-carboxy-cis,cis-mucoante lactonizing enzyme [Lindgomyces ingoldianus]KAF2473412.1 3-carboxy-cis,cis-mucoante lactonizing enzyme [Lindgomyces ingoldianus]
MLPSHQFLIPLFGSFATAANLYASHYSGNINYLTFSGSSLTLTSSTKSGNSMPSWITYDGPGKALYVPDENYGQTGTLTSFSIGANGALTQSGKVTATGGAVANCLYGGSDGKSFIANAHYGSSTVSTFKLPLNGGQALQTLKFTMSGKGANPSRQDAPHPHHVFTDPTGGYLLSPDLGADVIRIWSIDKTSGKLTECSGAKTPAGTGPRHGTFWAPAAVTSSRVRRGNVAAAESTMLFVANELGNSVSGWGVSYPSSGCMTLSLKQTLTPYSGNSSAPSGTKVAEVHTKGSFLYSTNRNDKKFSPNDSITQYAISSTGVLTWVEATSSFGTYPRTFDINQAGDYVAIGDQTTANVAIVKRDPATGKLTGQAATLRIGSAGTPENEDGLIYDRRNSTLQLAQIPRLAASYPFRYRHGCIIGRGGKAICQGFNDYRAGYGNAMAKLKKHKSKREPERQPTAELQNVAATKTFMLSESIGGGGSHVNTPLSMHLEMMAIHSTLSASSLLASSAVSSQKSYCKLSGGNSKRKARPRHKAVKNYVEKVYTAALAHRGLRPPHLNRTILNLEFQLGKDEEYVAPLRVNSTEKHHLKNQQDQFHNKGVCPYRQHKQQQRQQGTPINGYQTMERDVAATTAKTQPMLIPKRHTGSCSVTERMIHPRVNGADLYVARLEWRDTRDMKYCLDQDTRSSASPDDWAFCCNLVKEGAQTVLPDLSKPPTGFLYEDLLQPPAKTTTRQRFAKAQTEGSPNILSSRPCYRCISYMNSVGIKSIFWTNYHLVDALENLGNGGTSDIIAVVSSVFITKHEVLMLRQRMGTI